MKRVCVYCGSSVGTRPIYVDAALNLGRVMVERNLGLVYGGSNVGLMGRIADEVLAGGQEAIGVIPHGLVQLEVAHTGLTENHLVETLHERKAKMVELSDGLITMPGGHGSLDELFEALTWLQLGIHDMPVGILNIEGFYDHLIAHLDHASEQGFIKPQYREMLLVEETPEALLDAMSGFVPPADRPTWRVTPAEQS